MATNNRFKKSIESATDNTQDNITDTPIETISNNTLDNATVSVIDNALDNTTDNATNNMFNNTQTSISSKTSNDILKKVLESGKKDKGGNHTIYLSADVGEALVKLAKQSQKSKSTLVDEILREVLLNQ